VFIAYTSQNSYFTKLLDLYFPKEANLQEPETINGVYLVMEYMSFTLFDLVTKSEA
jgi:hypothetical protein